MQYHMYIFYRIQVCEFHFFFHLAALADNQGITDALRKNFEKLGKEMAHISSDRGQLPKPITFIPKSDLFMKLLYLTS